MEYKEATLGFGKRRLLIFRIMYSWAFTERDRGRRVVTLFMAAILLAGILTLDISVSQDEQGGW